MVSQNQKLNEEVSAKEEGVVTQISEQGDKVTLSKEGLSKAETDVSTESDSSQDLSTYSDSQLKTMVSKGEISQSEYIKEKARRSNEESKNI